MYLTIYNGIKD